MGSMAFAACRSVGIVPGEELPVRALLILLALIGVARGAINLLGDGFARPDAGSAPDDWILVTGVTSHAIDGFTYLGVAGTATSVAKTDWSILALGAAAYAMRSQEAVYAVQSQGLNFNTAYHVGVLSELANAMLANFDRELERIAEKRLERPPWGLAERKRMRRVLNERP